MVIVQHRSRRKPTGGRYKTLYRAKRKAERGHAPTNTLLAPRVPRTVRLLGGHEKTRLLSADKANVYNPKTKKYQVVTIKTVSDNPANRHFVRQNVMTKGAVIDTDLGKAKITSRPGQNGSVNAVLL